MTSSGSKYPLAVSTWGEEERDAILKVLDSGRFTMGKKVEEFEREYAAWVGSKYAVMVNSGSSANLLMVAAYTLRNGVGVAIVPAVSWSTSYAPFQQYNWTLKFVDIDKDTLNYDMDELNRAWAEISHYNPEACGEKLILAVNLLGNPNDFRWFPSMNVLEDNCESMGAKYAGMRTGNFGLMSSHSMFFSHHIQTMEGGIITTDDEYFYHMLLCLRSHGWTRHLPIDNKLGVEPSAYEFIYPGYNVRPIEMQAAVGIEQLKKIDGFIKGRKENAERWKEVCAKRNWWMQKEVGESSWFSFAIVDDNIDEIRSELTSKGFESRPIVGGNFTRSKSMEYYDRICGIFKNADRIHEKGIYIGNHHNRIDFGL